MASHSRMSRRRRQHSSTPGQPDPSTAVARGVSVEETFAPDVDELPTPAGFGTEASRSSQSFAVLDSYRVPDQTLAYLREVSLSVASNGEAKVSVAGTTYGPFTGSVDITLPLDPGVLTEGYQVRVHHQSTDGSSTTTRAQLSVLEV